MELTYNQSLKFLIFYRKLYGCNNGLPHIKRSQEQEHIKKRHKCLKKVLKEQYNQPYIHRGGRADTYGENAFSWLRLQYGPVIDDD